LATIINKLLHNLSIRCAKGDSIYDYFHVAVIGYGQDSVVKSAFDGAMTGKDLVPISELANNPLRIEDRVKKADDGNGGLVEQSVKFPLWFEAKHAGGTPMSSAFKMAAEIVQRWVAEHAKGFPPIVINITDGESTDGGPVPVHRDRPLEPPVIDALHPVGVAQFSVEAFSCQKAGNARTEYEDAWAIRGSDSPTRCLVVIDDGATESSFSALWAALLVENF